MNLTEMNLVKSAVSDAGQGSVDSAPLSVMYGRLLLSGLSKLQSPHIGVTAELFWFHDTGYFEEFLAGKSGELLSS